MLQSFLAEAEKKRHLDSCFCVIPLSILTRHIPFLLAGRGADGEGREGLKLRRNQASLAFLCVLPRPMAGLAYRKCLMFAHRHSMLRFRDHAGLSIAHQATTPRSQAHDDFHSADFLFEFNLPIMFLSLLRDSDWCGKGGSSVSRTVPRFLFGHPKCCTSGLASPAPTQMIGRSSPAALVLSMVNAVWGDKRNTIVETALRMSFPAALTSVCKSRIGNILEVRYHKEIWVLLYYIFYIVWEDHRLFITWCVDGSLCYIKDTRRMKIIMFCFHPSFGHSSAHFSYSTNRRLAVPRNIPCIVWQSFPAS